MRMEWWYSCQIIKVAEIEYKAIHGTMFFMIMIYCSNWAGKETHEKQNSTLESSN